MNRKGNPRVIDGTYRASRDLVFLALFAFEAIVIGSLILTFWFF
jgi:hypothetical protein